jgi:hypothetical protein
MPPLRGLIFMMRVVPTACAVGYYHPPLKGLKTQPLLYRTRVKLLLSTQNSKLKTHNFFPSLVTHHFLMLFIAAHVCHSLLC